MIYRVIGSLTLTGETSADNNEYEFDNLEDAKDFYRDSMISMSETISDFGGTYAITLVSVENKHIVLMKRNVISTTINEVYYE